MIWEFDEGISSQKDFADKYSHTVVRMKDGLAFIRPSSDSRTFSARVYDKNGKDNAFEVSMKDDPFELGMRRYIPRPGFFYHGKGRIAFLNRSPMRQWRRTYSENTYYITEPHLGTVGRSVDLAVVDSPVLRALTVRHERDYFMPLSEAMKELQRPDILGVILTDEFSVVPYSENVNAIVGAHGIVALADIREPKILTSPILEQELYDLTIKDSVEWNIKTSKFMTK